MSRQEMEDRIREITRITRAAFWPGESKLIFEAMLDRYETASLRAASTFAFGESTVEEFRVGDIVECVHGETVGLPAGRFYRVSEVDGRLYYLHIGVDFERAPSWKVGGFRLAFRPPTGETGWLPWNGGACPVSVDCPVTTRLRAGDVATRTANAWRWDWSGSGSDIIAFRIASAATSKETPNPGFLVWAPDRQVPSKVHARASEAYDEAKRLAWNHPGCKFFVMAAIGVHHVPMAERTWTEMKPPVVEDTDRTIPF